ELEVLPQKSVFHFPSQSGKALMLIIDPYSDQYFRDTFLVTIPASGSQAHYLGVFTVPEKLHRPRFIVTNENGSPVHSAKIHVQENILTSNRAGIASTTFASPGLEFLVRIDPPDGSNLVPYQESLQIPISKKPIDIPITLLQGASISGLVTAGPDSLPLAGARVFLDDYQVWEYGLPLIETFTDENGNYTLNGVPEEFVYTAGGQAVPLSLKIRATKSDPNTAYFGDAKDIILPVNAPVYLHLEILEGADLTHIWELPVEIESATNLGGNTYRLSGAFVSIPDNPNFQLVLTETRLDFQEVQVVLIPGPTGKLIPDPIQSSIELDALSIPVGIMHAFQGKLTPVSAPGTSGQNSTNSVLIVREESPGKGLIEGKVSMDLASFAFSYNYTGKLHLGNTPDDIKLAVFRPTSVPYPQRAFSVMSYASVRGNGPVIADPTFKVHEFSASADRYQSYVFQDTVALFTVLHTNIPLASPSDLEIQAGYINILPDNILPFQQGDALTFSLETWEFQASSSWYYDNNNGGIHIPTVTIKTGSLDVPVKNLIIRYDDIDVGQLNINKRTGTGLSIAGVAELEITGQDPVFYLDPKVPTDLMPHWRIEILSDGNTPAAKTNIPEFQPGQITFNSFSLISNGEQYLDIDEQTVWIYEVLEFQLHGIQTSLNYFTLTGEADLHIPDVPGTSGVLSFSKPANNIVMQMDHLNVNLDGIGKVEFISANYVGAQHFTQGKFTAAGTIRAYDDQQNSIELKAQLLRTPNACRIEVIQVNNQNQKIVCGSQGTNYLEVLDGQMPANLTANNWETFYFNALPRSSKGLKADTEIIRFEVVGDIEASGAAISVTDMNTPFGNLKIIFDLADLSLSAFLHVTQDIPMGVVTIQEADLNFLMAEKGFYFMLAAKGDVPVAGVIDIISLAGHYSEFTPYMLQVWNEYTYQAVPESFQNGFSGFLINGKWTPVDASTGFDVIPEVIYLDFSASIIVEIRIAADFAEDSYEFSVLGAGEFLLLFGGPCFDTGVGVLVEVLVGAKVQNSNFDIYGCASVNLLGYYQVCAPFGIPPVCLDWCSSDCWSGGVRVDLTIGESVGGIEMDVDINGPSCSGNPMQIETAVQDLGIDCD
ncbi:MAG: carboxypeptidase regulatory-like domain-containing protein, partial [Saprospiraceae bacterium]|nr:carboxypeptidase regulatory-like domain-containing protein [Saprospiraceae bacterium]